MSTESLAIIAIGLALGALVKGISGLGLPMVAIPVMAGFMGVQHAVAIMVVPNFMVQFLLAVEHRRELPALPPLWRLVASAIAGAAAGSWVLASIGERWLVLLIALWVGLYLATLALSVDAWAWLRRARSGGPLIIFMAGIAQGATGISGPVVASYMHALRLQKGAYILCANVMFTVFTVAQVASLAALGLLTWPRLQQGLVACVPVAVVLPVAILISRRISQRAFNRVVIALLVVMEIRLILRLAGAF